VPVRFHCYSSEVVGKLRPLGVARLEPGDTALVEIRLAAPVTAVRGDSFIIRRPSPRGRPGSARTRASPRRTARAGRRGRGLEEKNGERKILPHDFTIERVEPLKAELRAFLAACRGEAVAYVDGAQGRRALETAFAVREAIG